MTTKPASPVKVFPENSIEAQTYSLVDSLKEFIPIENDRNRLGYGLVQYLQGNGDAPEILLKSAKIRIERIELKELAQKISDGLKTIK